MDWIDVEMELCATGQEQLAQWVREQVTKMHGLLDSVNARAESKRPDTTDMYQFVWFTETGFPLECYLHFHEPDPAAYFYPGADASMELMHVLLAGEHDIAGLLTVRACEDIEQAALLDATKKNREAREKSAIWKHFQPRDYHSMASFLG